MAVSTNGRSASKVVVVEVLLAGPGLCSGPLPRMRWLNRLLPALSPINETLTGKTTTLFT